MVNMTSLIYIISKSLKIGLWLQHWSSQVLWKPKPTPTKSKSIQIWPGLGQIFWTWNFVKKTKSDILNKIELLNYENYCFSHLFLCHQWLLHPWDSSSSCMTIQSAIFHYCHWLKNPRLPALQLQSLLESSMFNFSFPCHLFLRSSWKSSSQMTRIVSKGCIF